MRNFRRINGKNLMVSCTWALPCVAALFMGVAWCQTADSVKILHTRVDVYGGYSRVGPSPYARTSDNPADQGFGGGGDLHLFKWLAVTAEAHWMHVTYDAEDKSKSLTVLGGPRFFLPVSAHGVIIPFADVLGGMFTFDNTYGFSNPLRGTVSPAFAIDGGSDVRIIGAFYVRGQAGYAHSGFSATYDVDRRYVNNHHSRLLVEGVFHF
jgi:hypothetical protein